ncbi:MAG TPA: alpha/beta hydrolase [Candidatus Sulfotelmatobacter sp.]|jgi:pimeloyl-ACP methyl ester carboxylesterase|nr:alpha/beta hydrolase [Candidatus Sulfotelmatobacter sp.]
MSSLLIARHTIESSDGVTLAVQEWGKSSGPAILFIHGISQCHLSWRRQYESDLASHFRLVTFDLRGHGSSSKPLDAPSYQENPRWAHDLNAIMDALHLERPVLVGWSYGGRPICDYLQTCGDSRLAAINFISASTKTSPEFASPGGKLLRALMSDDPANNMQNVRVFLEACSVQAHAPADLETMIAYNLQTPAQVRDHLLRRTTPYEEALRQVKVPVLIIHGEQDQIVIPAMARYTASVIAHAEMSLYPNCGHMPFWEEATRFNQELKDFVRKAQQ